MKIPRDIDEWEKFGEIKSHFKCQYLRKEKINAGGVKKSINLPSIFVEMSNKVVKIFDELF